MPGQFLNYVARASVSCFKSPGHGYDYRIEEESLTGNMLVYRDEVIHFAAFNLGESGRQAGFHSDIFDVD